MMLLESRKSDQLLRAASALVLAGIIVELISLVWSHPIAFLLFAIVGGALVLMGLATYLFWLVERRPDERAAGREPDEIRRTG